MCKIYDIIQAVTQHLPSFFDGVEIEGIFRNSVPNSLTGADLYIISGVTGIYHKNSTSQYAIKWGNVCDLRSERISREHT